METSRDVPFTVGGIVTPNGIKYGLAVPDALSFLVGGSVDTLVLGLRSFDPSTWPPLIIHYYFDLMAGIGFLMLLAPIFFFFFLWRKRARWAFSRLMAGVVVVVGALSILAVEFGWMFTEEGRQPYTIRGIMLTNDAFTNSPTVMAYAILFPLFYLVLLAVTSWVLISHYRKTI